MALQVKLTNRRQFLGRSALGAGSLLFGPLLLESCTDHLIPPDKPIKPPLFGDEDSGSGIDWNNAAKTAVSTALGMIPEGGEILSALTDILWPDNQPSVWDQIKDQVDKDVERKIADSVYQQVSDDLAGLQGVLQLYLDAVNDGNPEHIYDAWANLRSDFVLYLPHFQETGNEFQLLPLYAQYSNLYLTVLQDPLVPMKDAQGNIIKDGNGNYIPTGKTWGMNDKEVDDVKKHLLDYVVAAGNYTLSTFEGKRNLINVAYDRNNCEPLRTRIRFDRSMTRSVLDYMDLWPYYDYTKYPLTSPITVKLTREMYSDPYGSIAEGGPEFTEIYPPWATQLPTMLEIWGGGPDDRIDGVRLTYPAATGPGGKPSTGWMGSNTTYQGRHQVYNLDLSDTSNPIVSASTTYGPGVVSLVYQRYKDLNETRIGGNKGNGDNDSKGDKFFNAPWTEAMSSLLIHGYDGINNDADLVIFGSQLWQSPPAALDAVRAHYVRSPKERSAAEFAKAFPKLGITEALITQELKTARQAYWAKLKARAAKLK